MKPWFRVYNDILTDEKLLSLSLDNQAIFFKLLAVSNLNNSCGSLPKLALISKQIGVRVDKVRSAVGAMIEAGLIDEDVDAEGFTLHGWSNRQFESDDATARSRRCRDGKRNVAPSAERNASRGPGRATDQSRADTEQSRENPPLPPLEGGGGARGGGPSPAIRVVGPDGPIDVPAACTEADFDRLTGLASAYFDRLGMTDQIARFVRVWGVHHAPDWIEALLADLAGKAAGGKRRISEGLGTSILARWMAEGGIPAERLIRARSDPGGGTPDSPSEAPRAAPAAFQRPLTDHQRKMAAWREVANAPLTPEEQEEARVGFRRPTAEEATWRRHG